MADDDMKFFNQAPVRSEVFEDYDPDADPDEVVGKADLPFQGDIDALKEEVAKPSSEEDVMKVGLPSFQMGEEPPEEIDREEWKGAKEKPNDRLHNLWRAYKYGTDHTEAGDKRVRGQIVGELNGMIYKAVHDVGGGAPMGELEREGRRQVLKAADQYDPRHGSKLSSYAYGKLFPEGSNVLTNQVRKYGDSVQLSEDRFSKVMDYKDIITEFENKHGREPSNEEIADRMSGLSLKDVKKMRREAADEVDMTNMLDDDENSMDSSFATKDAVKAVYHDSNPDEQRAMEYMFPDYLDGEEPPVSIDAGGMSWIGDQIGKSSSGMSKMKNRIKSRIRELI
jgi:DNA-directed RNA polymerase specialized sigma subunit